MEDDQDPNKSFARLQEFDLDDLDDVVGCRARWFAEVQKKLKVDGRVAMRSAKFAVQTKAVLSGWLEDASDVMGRQSDTISKMTEMIELLKTEALADKAAVIRLQGELLERKEEELKALRTAVQTTVQDTVQTEIRSYGDVLKARTAPAINPTIFKKVVKDVIKEEDRSKSLMVFGLAEEEGEQLDDKISSVFLELGEKPRVAAVRLGKRPEAGSRPVKVTLASSTAVQQIMSKARHLRQVERLKAVYVSPDRSPAERSARRLLVEERKKRAEDEPGRNHFIKGGKVCSVEKT